MSYPPLADVRKDLRVEWYRCPVGGAEAARAFQAQRFAGLVPGRRSPGAVSPDRRPDLFLLATADLGGRCRRTVLPRNRGNLLARRCGPRACSWIRLSNESPEQAFLVPLQSFGLVGCL